MADIDLRDLAPRDLSFFDSRGVEYYIPGDPAVETIIEAMQLQTLFEQSNIEEDRDGVEKALTALQLVVRNMIDDAGKKGEAPYPRLGVEGIMTVLALAMGGAEGVNAEPPSTPESLVREALTGDDGSESGSGADNAVDAPPTDAVEAAQPATTTKKPGSRSTKRSPAASSA